MPIYGIDQRLFMLLFNTASDNYMLGNLMINITEYSSKVFALIYGIGVIYLAFRRDKMLLPYLAGPGVAAVMVQVIRFFYLRPRPFVELDIDSLIYHSANGSMPSMHATSAFVIATAIWCVNKKAGSLALGLASITSLSRVMVGVHFPLDILLGAVMGSSICLLGFWLYGKMAKEKTAAGF